MNTQVLPSAEPWRELPPRIGELLRPGVPALSDEVIEAIRDRVPAYSRPLRGRFGAALRRGVEEALGQFADLIVDPELDRSGAERVYRGLGRGEYREQRSLDALLEAYRVGARVSWRRVSQIAIEANVDRRTLALLADAVFAYIDSLSAFSAEGYAAEQSAAAGETERRRRRLARLLLTPDPDPDDVAAAAQDAGWELPRAVAALAWSEEGRSLRSRLPPDALTVADDGIALIRDPEAPGLRARLERGAAQTTAALGPAVSIDQAAASADRARAVLELIRAGVIGDSGLVRADAHLGALSTYGDPAALSDLARVRLAPLDDETPASQARLTKTLRAWLDLQGEVARVAAELHVHPQTVRYRLARLRELFGDRLDDPQARFELTLALRAPSERP
ncbi:MAG: helix-turn-helix domain-containing protein [Solirubrobacterales bacterium]